MTIESVSQAREKTKSLNARFTLVEKIVIQLSSGHATLFERVGQIESRMEALNMQGLERMHLKLMNSNDKA